MRTALLLLLLAVSLDHAQAQLGTIVDQRMIVIPVDQKKNTPFQADYTFSLADRSGDYMVRVDPGVNQISLAEVTINNVKVNKLVPLYLHRSSLISVNLELENTVKVKLLGKPGTGATITIYDLKKGVNVAGPILFERSGKESKITNSFNVPFAGIEYLLEVKASDENSLRNHLSLVSLNGKLLFTPFDLLFARDKRIVKFVPLNQVNGITTLLLGKKNPGISVSVIGISDPEIPESTPSAGTLNFTNLDPLKLNPLSQQIVLSLTGADLNPTSGEVIVIVNGDRRTYPIPPLVTNSTITLPGGTLEAGFNIIRILTADADGNDLAAEGEFWAGRNQVTLRIVDSLGNSVAAPASLNLIQADQSISVEENISVAGTLLRFLPNTPVQVSVGTDSYIGMASIDPLVDSEVTVTLTARPPINNIANEDFSQGLDGWDVIGSPEVFQIPSATASEPPAAGLFSLLTADVVENLGIRLRVTPDLTQVSKTFRIPPGTRSMVVRYRRHGSCATTYSRIEVFSPAVVRNVGVGTSDFTWYSRQYELSGQESFATLVASARGNDCADASLELDYVVLLGVSATFELAERDNPLIDEAVPKLSSLRLASVAINLPNPHCNGNSVFDAILNFRGADNDAITSATLHILQNGKREAKAVLAVNSLTAPILSSFGPDGFIGKGSYFSGGSCVGLFELSPAEAGQLEPSQPRLEFELEIQTRLNPKPIVFSHTRPLRMLRRPATVVQRYSTKIDWEYGGDDWGQPQILPILTRMTALGSEFEINDISNQHGNRFPPHIAHQRGLEVDAKVIGFPTQKEVLSKTTPQEVGRTAALNLLDLLGKLTTEELAKIEGIIVTYEPQNISPFYAELVASGEAGTRFNKKLPTEFIRTDWERVRTKEIKKNDRFPAHRDHFHIEFAPVKTEN